MRPAQAPPRCSTGLVSTDGLCVVARQDRKRRLFRLTLLLAAFPRSYSLPPWSLMAGLLLGCTALPGGLTGLPARKGSLGVQPNAEQQQPHSHHQLRSGAASCFVVAAAEGLATTPLAEFTYGGGAVSTSMAVGTKPPRTHTRRLVVPAYALAGTRTRRRRGGGLGGGDDDEAGGGGGDDGGFWGGDGGSGGGGGDFWGAGDDEASGDGNLAVRLQDLLLLWSLFSGLAFCQTVWYVSPKPKAISVPPAFAALSYSGIKASLLQLRPQQVAC